MVAMHLVFDTIARIGCLNYLVLLFWNIYPQANPIFACMIGDR